MIAEAEKMMTPPTVAERLGVKASTVRGWCRSGELKSANLANAGCRRPRFKIHPVDLQIFLDRRSAGPTPKVPRRRRKDTSVTEYF